MREIPELVTVSSVLISISIRFIRIGRCFSMIPTSTSNVQLFVGSCCRLNLVYDLVELNIIANTRKTRKVQVHKKFVA